MLDLKISGGTILDGTGAPGMAGDVGIRDGRIVAMGRADEPARRTIDAAGAIVAPGFVDIHTHYDAQVLWDPLLTISPWHGVTTAVMGACGFGIAPTRPAHRGLILRTLERVEAMSLAALEAGVGAEWPFETFPEYLDAVERVGLGINVGVMIGHTPARLYAMGEAAVERAATDDEVRRMQAIVSEAMAAGALGFATSISKIHVGFAGKPVPSRLAAFDEMRALAHSMGASGRGLIHYNVAREARFDDCVALARASGRPVCWTAVLAGQLGPWRHREVLAKNAELIARGFAIYPQVACRPIVQEFDFRAPVVFDSWKFFEPVRTAADDDARARLYADPTFRAGFRQEAAGRGGRDGYFAGGAEEGTMRRASLAITELARHPQVALLGRTVESIARERGAPLTDTYLDLALETGLEARFRMPLVNFQEEAVAEILTDPNAVLGLGDGGAHLSQLCDACYPTHLLGHWVREKKTLSVERAVHMLTGRPAAVFGLTDRGLLAPGRPADIAVFDPTRVAAGPLERVYDLPAGADRLISRPSGMVAVCVNGALLEPGGRSPGRLLRHGRA